MPGFVSHTVMAKDVYHKINNKDISLEYMLTYSLGGDLCKYAKCRYDSHHKDQDKFIDNMIDYIKRNKLTDNKEVMGVLYGHICHYMMDDTLHPLIRKIDKTCVDNKHNHALIEEYYDNYLVKEKYKISKRKYLKQKILSTKVNKTIANLIDNVYLETYHTKNVSKYYKFNLTLYRLLRRVYLLFNNKLIEKISGLNRFLNNNKNIDLLNDKSDIKYKDYQKKDRNDSLIKLYDKCIDRTIDYIRMKLG